MHIALVPSPDRDTGFSSFSRQFPLSVKGEKAYGHLKTVNEGRISSG